MQRSETRFLTTHTGSLIRPAALIEAPAADADAEARAGYERALTEAVAGVVARQWDVGLDVVNDGEFGKSGWSGYALDRISGFEIRQDQLKPLDWLGRDRERFKDFFTDNPEMPLALTGAPTQVCVGPVEYTGHDFIARDLANLKAATAGHQDREMFCTSVAPASTAYNGVNEYYKTEEEYVYAIADALRQEYLAIHQAGFILQVDDAVLANMYDHLIQQGEEAYRRWAHPGGPDPLPRLLRQLARPARRGRAARGAHRPHLAGERRRLLHRGREPEARVGVGGVGADEAPGRQDPHPRCHHPSHDHGRAPAAGSPAA